MMKFYLLKCLSTFLLCFTIICSYAKAPTNVPTKQGTINKMLMDCAPGTAKTTLEINNVRAHFRTTGTIFFQDETTEPGYEIPKDSGKYSIYAGALWIGALDDENNLKLAAQTYRQSYQGFVDDFWPGPLNENGETTRDVCSEYDKFWRITKEEIDAFMVDFSDGTIDDELSEDIKSWKGDFIDADGDNLYNPEKGDYPKINGDEAIWSVINDNGNFHTNTFTVDTTTMPPTAMSSLPLGIEIQTLVYGFNNDNLANITFVDYTLINKSSENLKKAYLGTWLDPDLGNYEDDFVGCDIERNLGICYNGDPNDDEDADGYGTDPPFVAIQILNGITTTTGDKLGMSGFVFYNNDPYNEVQGDPQTAEEHYNYLIGKWKNGASITLGGTGFNEGSTEEVTHMFPDNPSDAEGWSECSEGNTPADRRFVMATGPFDMQPGAAKKMTQSILWVRPEGAFDEGCPSFDGIRDLADEVLEFYNANLAGDDIAPVITINGDDLVNVELGADWTPPTATAMDNIDGEITVIIDDSALNLDANGAYDIIYTAADSNGNTSERIVTVVVGTGVGILDYAVDAVLIYPNPIIDFAYINLNGQIANLIQIFDVQGKLILEADLGDLNHTTINLSKLESGIYFSKIINQNKLVSINKFIKR